MSKVIEMHPDAQLDDEAEIRARFAAAQDKAARSEAASPPEVDRDAPHGRDDAGNPLAPYGWTVPQRKGEQSRPKLIPGGRRPADSRVIDEDSAPAEPKAGRQGRGGAGDQPKADREQDYSQGLAEAHNAVWVGLTGLSKVAPKIPVIGPRLPATKIGAIAAVWSGSQDRLCGAVALAAKHNDSAARFAAKMSKGEATWVLTAAAMIMPVAAQIGAVLAGDKVLAEMDTSLEQLAADNDRAFEASVAAALAEMEAAAQAEMAGAAA